jgi:hypothetical protein
MQVQLGGIQFGKVFMILVPAKSMLVFRSCEIILNLSEITSFIHFECIEFYLCCLISSLSLMSHFQTACHFLHSRSTVRSGKVVFVGDHACGKEELIRRLAVLFIIRCYSVYYLVIGKT